MSGAGQHGLQDWKADLICGHWKTHKTASFPVEIQVKNLYNENQAVAFALPPDSVIPQLYLRASDPADSRRRSIKTWQGTAYPRE